MEERRTEGVVLRATPFKENDRILSVLTPDRGILSLYVRGLSKSKPQGVNLATPLCRAEFVFKKGKSDLHRFLDGTILDLHLPLRQSYRHLEAGGKMLNAILKTQMPGKNSHALYLLLTSFLKKLSEATYPETFWTTFLIKLLKHEGLLEISPTCLACSLPARYIVSGESRCKDHSQGEGFVFKEEEWMLLLTLFETRSFDTLLTLQLPTPLMKGIEACFEAALMV